jgi:hypothetical protein
MARGRERDPCDQRSTKLMSRAPETTGEFEAFPTIASQLPLVFSAGNRWDKLTCRCGDCKTELADETVRGHVTRPFGPTFIMDAWGLCQQCKTFTPFHYRFPPDMTIVGRSPKDGTWGIWEPRPNGSKWRRLLSLIGLTD